MDTCTRLYLIRHGEILNAADGAYTGITDVDLTEVGISQMKAVSKRLARESLAAVYCSDLVRSCKGAKIVAGPHHLNPVSCSSLREVNFGKWEGLTFRGIEKKYPGALAERGRNIAAYRVPGGESLADLSRRVWDALDEILSAHQGKTIACVLHGGVNRVILARAMNLDLKHFYAIDQDCGCLNIIEFYDELAVIKLINGRTPMDF